MNCTNITAEYDYAKLLGKIAENHLTAQKLAEKMGIAGSTLSAKLNNKSEFSQTEIKKACDILNIPVDKMTQYFFSSVLRKSELS